MLSLVMKTSLIIALALVKSCAGFSTGFWYGETRPPVTNYDSINYANMSVKINRRIDEGPGQNLLYDRYDREKELYVGNTINRQTFETQFILDMSYILGISTNRINVTEIAKGDVHFTWESETVIVYFIFTERNDPAQLSLISSIAELTSLIQNPTSKVYTGTNVTIDIDPLWGLEVLNWDVSLKLTYPIENIGGSAVKSNFYLDQGGFGSCDRSESLNISYYCEFERFFEDDIAYALNVSYYRIQILFIKKAAVDAVLVHFRIAPPMITNNEHNITVAIAHLMRQVHDKSSRLYQGNVTLRVDPTWGVSETFHAPRKYTPLFTRKSYTYDTFRLSNSKIMALSTPYERCKENRRCNWGVAG